MSLLTQFYPSSSGGAGSGVIGYVGGVNYGNTGVGNLASCGYNPVTGWYYLCFNAQPFYQTYITEPIAGLLVMAGQDGENFPLSYARSNSASQGGAADPYFITPAGTVNDSVATSYYYGASGQYYNTFSTTYAGGSEEAPVSFTQRSNVSSSQVRVFSGGYYTLGNRYYILMYNTSNTWFSSTSTDGISWTSGSGLGFSVSSFSPRGRVAGYLTTGGSVLQKTTDGGLNWAGVGTPLPVSGQVAAGAETNSNLVISSGYYTTNDGSSWTPITAPAGVSSLGSVTYSDKADRFIAWANSSSESVNGKMLVSTDGTGSNWVYAASGNPELQSQLWGRIIGASAAINLGTDLYYLPPSLIGSQSNGLGSKAYVAKVDVSTL